MTDPFEDIRYRIIGTRQCIDNGLTPWSWHVYSLEDAECLLAAVDELAEKAIAVLDAKTPEEENLLIYGVEGLAEALEPWL